MKSFRFRVVGNRSERERSLRQFPSDWPTRVKSAFHESSQNPRFSDTTSRFSTTDNWGPPPQKLTVRNRKRFWKFADFSAFSTKKIRSVFPQRVNGTSSATTHSQTRFMDAISRPRFRHGTRFLWVFKTTIGVFGYMSILIKISENILGAQGSVRCYYFAIITWLNLLEFVVFCWDYCFVIIHYMLIYYSFLCCVLCGQVIRIRNSIFAQIECKNLM